MNKQRIDVCIGVDVDAVAGWLGSYGGAGSPSDIQRGMFAGEVGTPRLVRLFERIGIRTTWFIPGHSVETFPDQMRAVVDAGHEVGAHGYSHENPVAMNADQERDVLERSIEVITQLAGVAPRGYVAPWWEMSTRTASLLVQHGFTYDHSQNYNDFVPFYARVGDTWTPIDFGQPASGWMTPLVRGQEVDLVEFCGNWYLDDLPPMMFIKQAPNSHGFVNPRDVESLWQDQFDWVCRELDYAVMPLTLHPDVSGRPQVLLMLERLFDRWAGTDGVEFVTFEEAASEFRRRYPFHGSARPPSIGRDDGKLKTGNGQASRTMARSYGGVEQ
ncbi:MAG TPA: polysaccharide deacetylase [Acidimicrobiales bacterium]|nr:polysaccharide deacetylase [Acidimicrobiales bacterium]